MVDPMINRRAFLSLFPKAAAVVAGAGVLLKGLPPALSSTYQHVEYKLGFTVTDPDAWWVGRMRATNIHAWGADTWRRLYGSINNPFATLKEATNVADSGDTIYVLPGHKETIGGLNIEFEDAMTVSPNLSIAGSDRPGFVFANTKTFPAESADFPNTDEKT
ncbi:MAG: hypothetical protein IH973_05195 [Myxococcales bacterium]|nr:hypothetical protein [Myxococcales bacterium]